MRKSWGSNLIQKCSLTYLNLGLGPLCCRFEGPKWKLIDVTNISISTENRISKSVYAFELRLFCRMIGLFCEKGMLMAGKSLVKKVLRGRKGIKYLFCVTCPLFCRKDTLVNLSFLKGIILSFWNARFGNSTRSQNILGKYSGTFCFSTVTVTQLSTELCAAFKTYQFLKNNQNNPTLSSHATYCVECKLHFLCGAQGTWCPGKIRDLPPALLKEKNAPEMRNVGFVFRRGNAEIEPVCGQLWKWGLFCTKEVCCLISIFGIINLYKIRLRVFFVLEKIGHFRAKKPCVWGSFDYKHSSKKIWSFARSGSSSER